MFLKDAIEKALPDGAKAYFYKVKEYAKLLDETKNRVQAKNMAMLGVDALKTEDEYHVLLDNPHEALMK